MSDASVCSFPLFLPAKYQQEGVTIYCKPGPDHCFNHCLSVTPLEIMLNQPEMNMTQEKLGLKRKAGVFFFFFKHQLLL